jgi:hypothetical protein
VTKRLIFGLHTFAVSFILAVFSKPILSINILSAHGLLVISSLLFQVSTSLPHEPPLPTFLWDFQGVLAGRWPLHTAHNSSPAPTLQLCLKIFCCLGLFWSATMASSHRCPRYMMVRVWFWRGCCICSRCKLPAIFSPYNIVEAARRTHQISSREARARIFKCLWSPGINSKE